MTPRKTTKTTVRIAALLAFATATTTVAPAALATNAFGTTQPAATVAPAAVTAAPSPTASVDFDLGRYNQTRNWRGTATIAPQSGATITSVEMRRYDASGTLTAAGQGTVGVNQLPTDITAPTRIVYIVHTDKGVYAAGILATNTGATPITMTGVIPTDSGALALADGSYTVGTSRVPASGTPTVTWDNTTFTLGAHATVGEPSITAMTLDPATGPAWGFYTTLPALTATISSDTQIVSATTDEGYSVSVSGTTATINLTGKPSKATLRITDEFGRTASQSINVPYDDEGPQFSNLRATGGQVNAYGDYATSGNVTISGTATDTPSGVYSVELVKDGEVVTTLKRQGGNFTFTITEPGTYKVQTMDEAGLTNEVGLHAFTGGDTDVVAVDSTIPTLTVPDAITNAKTLGDGQYWLTSAPTEDLTFTFSDDQALSPRGMSLIFDGRPIAPTREADNKYTFTIPASEFTDGTRHQIDFYGADRGLHRTSWTGTISTSTSQATINAAVRNPGDMNVTPYGVFSRTPIQVQLTPQGGGGLAQTYSEPSSGMTVSPDGVATITGSINDPTVTVTDPLGRSKTLHVATALGWPSTRAAVDTQAPTMTTDITATEGTWFSSTNGAINSFTAHDDNGIATMTATVNGTQVATINPSDKAGEAATTGTLDVDYTKATRAEDGSYQVTITMTDLAGNVSSRNYTFYVDDQAPTITNFVVVNPSYAPGKTINGSDRYGLFVQGVTRIKAQVSDPAPSSGLGNALMTFYTPSGTVIRTESAPINSGVAEFDIPSGFKGFVSATATDKVGNLSDTQRPDGLVSEDSNTTITSTDLTVELGTPAATNSAGVPLYKDSASGTLTAVATHSGIRTLTWGYGDTTLGTATVSPDGQVDNPAVQVTATDKNLITGVSVPLTLSGEYPAQDVWIHVADNAGYEAETRRTISVDATAPELTVTFDQTNQSGFYNTDRHATVTVRDNNFDPSSLTTTGLAGTWGTWVHSGDTWTNTITFADNTDYDFTLSASDMVGHESNTFTSGRFTVDKVAPVVSVAWNTTDVRNGKYYNQVRTATITVVEDHFDPALNQLTGTGSISGWSSVGSTHTATVTFPEGVHTFGFHTTDQAGNPSNEVTEGEFIVDTTKPEINISGLTKGAAYYQLPTVGVTYSDTNADTSSVTAVLVGRKGNVFKPTVSGGYLDLSEIPEEAKYDDLYTLTIKGTDLAGNDQTASVEFILNRYGSNVDVTGTNYQGRYLQAPADVDLEETTVEALNEDKTDIKVTLDGAPYPVAPALQSTTRTGGDTGDYVYSYHIDKAAFQDEGTYLIQVISQTEGGLDQVSRLGYSFVVDSTNPEIQVSGIRNDAAYRSESRDFTVTPRDMTTVTLEAQVDGKTMQLLSDENGVYTGTLPQSTSAHTVVLKAADMAGNVTETTISDVYVNASTFGQVINWIRHHILATSAAGSILAAAAALIVWARRRKNAGN